MVRALEHAAALHGTVPAGEGLATQKIGAYSRLRVVTAILSGTHEPDTSHYELLRAFADDRTLDHMDEELNAHNYRTHEFGDSVFLENTRLGYQSLPRQPEPSRRLRSRQRFHVLPLTLFRLPVSEYFFADMQAKTVITFEL